MHITLARHGETQWSRTGQHTGGTDLPLTEEGERQVAALGKRLAGSKFDLVLSSPALRASQTASALGHEFETDERLVELDYGEYEGLTTVQIRGRRPAWDLWFDGCPDGETVAEVGDRVDGVLQHLIESGAKLVMLVGHSHTFRVLAARYLGLEPEIGRLFKLDTATLSELGEYHSRPVVVRWNSYDHLR
ncbi:MAG: histidine phosphatase family protein [Egibacteraceae bacterium]